MSLRALRPLLPTSLRWRLAAWVGTMLIASAAIVFTVVYLSTGAQVRSQIDRDISTQHTALVQALSVPPERSSAAIAASAAAYLRGRPYSPTSPVLFVIVPGGVLSNLPELFGFSRPEAGETAAEQQSENQAAHQLRVARLGHSDAQVPDAGAIRILERPLAGTDGQVVVGAGEPLAQAERAQHDIARAFVLAGAATLLLALVASLLAGTRVSAPLRGMAAVARQVDGGELEPRMAPPPGSGTEVHVLAEAFNHMLDRVEGAFAAQRAFVADASHELRTPLTVIRGQLEVLASSREPDAAEVRRVEALLQTEVARINRLVDDLLLLAQAEQRQFLQPRRFDLQPFVTELWDGLSLTARRRFELGGVPAGTLHADPDRLAQALRNLARNAIDHTAPETGCVRLEVFAAGRGQLVFAVLDDGPGIPTAEHERVFERFHRLDAARSRAGGGAGLGLAIVRAIADAHGGQVRAAQREESRGARMELRLPGFAAR